MFNLRQTISVLADKKIAAVFRSRVYSPNHIGTDAAILNEVCNQLRKRGCAVVSFNEDSLTAQDVTSEGDIGVWITMARSPHCLEILKIPASVGATVINTPEAISHCRRGQMCNILSGHNIPFVEYLLADTDEMVLNKLESARFGKCWVKQADEHSRHKEDVASVRHAQEAQEILQEFFMRGIKKALICRHADGDVIRFYGVRHTKFFSWFFTGHNSPNAVSDKHVDLEQRLKELCDSAAAALELDVYGGDCVLDVNGQLKLIDINDWPSFAPCRLPAAKAIAKLVLTKLKDNK